MKKIAWLVLGLILLSGCTRQKTFDISVRVPAGSMVQYVYSQEEICPLKNRITLSLKGNWKDTEAVLLPLGNMHEMAGPVYLTSGLSAEIEVQKGVWYKIGLNRQNDSDKELQIRIQAAPVEVRIAE